MLIWRRRTRGGEHRNMEISLRFSKYFSSNCFPIHWWKLFQLFESEILLLTRSLKPQFPSSLIQETEDELDSEVDDNWNDSGALMVRKYSNIPTSLITSHTCGFLLSSLDMLLSSCFYAIKQLRLTFKPDYSCSFPRTLSPQCCSIPVYKYGLRGN